jgi:hypothetical protein
LANPARSQLAHRLTKNIARLLFRADTNRFPQRGDFQFSTLIAVTIATEKQASPNDYQPVSQIDPIVKNFSNACS